MEKINANACSIEGVSSISVGVTELRGRCEAGKPEALTAVQLTLTLPNGERHNPLMSAREAAALAREQNEMRERDDPGARAAASEQIEKEIRASLEALPVDVLLIMRKALQGG
jgi:hypothetical protein